MMSLHPARRDARFAPMGQGLAVLAIVALFGVGSTAAVGTYLWSLRVAAVRARVGALDARIAAVHRQIGRLDIEMTVRSRLLQQERWAPTLGLRPADSLQYGTSDDQIHALAGARRAELAAAALTPDTLRAPTVAVCVAPDCIVRPHPATGYALRARRQMDDLIGGIVD